MRTFFGSWLYVLVLFSRPISSLDESPEPFDENEPLLLSVGDIEQDYLSTVTGDILQIVFLSCHSWKDLRSLLGTSKKFNHFYQGNKITQDLLLIKNNLTALEEKVQYSRFFFTTKQMDHVRVIIDEWLSVADSVTKLEYSLNHLPKNLRVYQQIKSHQNALTANITNTLPVLLTAIANHRGICGKKQEAKILAESNRLFGIANIHSTQTLFKRSIHAIGRNRNLMVIGSVILFATIGGVSTYLLQFPPFDEQQFLTSFNSSATGCFFPPRNYLPHHQWAWSNAGLCVSTTQIPDYFTQSSCLGMDLSEVYWQPRYWDMPGGGYAEFNYSQYLKPPDFNQTIRVWNQTHDAFFSLIEKLCGFRPEIGGNYFKPDLVGYRPHNQDAGPLFCGLDKSGNTIKCLGRTDDYGAGPFHIGQFLEASVTQARQGYVKPYYERLAGFNGAALLVVIIFYAFPFISYFLG